MDKVKEQRDILLRGLNRIGDVFEYRYQRMSQEDLKEHVYRSLDIVNRELKELEERTS